MNHRVLVCCAGVCLLVGLGPVGCASAGDGFTSWAVTLEKALPGEKDLVLHVATREGKVLAAFGDGPKYNAFWHEADVSKLTVRDGVFVGPIKVTVTPDPWVPKDGKPYECNYTLAAPAGEGGKPSYTGTVRGKEVRSTVSAEKTPPPGESATERYNLRLFRALRMIAPARGRKGASVNYALDMTLSFAIEPDGTTSEALFESVVPDYRSYSAEVVSIDIKRRGPLLTGQAVIDVNYGRDARRVPKSVLRHTYTFKGYAIGSKAVARYDAKVLDVHDRNIVAWGTRTREKAPAPGQSTAKIRLHDGMGKSWPVILSLVLDDDGPIHGFAYASGWNHQVHKVDASKLRLHGGRLVGPMTVTLDPDVYKDPKVVITLDYTIDAKVQGTVLRGEFVRTGAAITARKLDGELAALQKKDVTGQVTGKLSYRTPPAVTQETLSHARLGLGWSMMGGKRVKGKKGWHHHSAVELSFEDGKVTGARLVNPKDPDVLDSQLVEATLKVDGTRVTGRVVFDVKSKWVADGRYAFDLYGMLRGGKLSGLWRGTFNGKPILTKSAKLHGMLSSEQQGG